MSKIKFILVILSLVFLENGIYGGGEVCECDFYRTERDSTVSDINESLGDIEEYIGHNGLDGSSEGLRALFIQFYNKLKKAQYILLKAKKLMKSKSEDERRKAQEIYKKVTGIVKQYMDFVEENQEKLSISSDSVIIDGRTLLAGMRTTLLQRLVFDSRLMPKRLFLIRVPEVDSFVLISIASRDTLKKVEELIIDECGKISAAAIMQVVLNPRLRQLTTLRLRNLGLAQTRELIGGITYGNGPMANCVLKVLDLSGCWVNLKLIERIVESHNMEQLEVLDLTGCKGLRRIKKEIRGLIKKRPGLEVIMDSDTEEETMREDREQKALRCLLN